MILEIVRYGHPALRARGRRVDKFDEKVRKLAHDMLETMREASGVGLAAQQVGRPLQLCVIDVSGIPDRPSRMWIGGEEVDPDEHMPMVLINPEVGKQGEIEVETEGCLSFPGISGDIPRPGHIRVKASALDGSEVCFEAEGLLSRAVQHEHDHLHGILFTDHMDVGTLADIQDGLRALQRAAN